MTNTELIRQYETMFGDMESLDEQEIANMIIAADDQRKAAIFSAAGNCELRFSAGEVAQTAYLSLFHENSRLSQLAAILMMECCGDYGRMLVNDALSSSLDMPNRQLIQAISNSSPSNGSSLIHRPCS